MSTTVLPRGRQTKLRGAWETTYGTNPGSAFFELNPYTVELTRTRALEADDVLGAGFGNLVDARPAGPSPEDGAGKIKVPLDMAQIGFWLAATLGRVTATGSGTLTHAFVSGNTSIPSLTLERDIVDGSQYEGAIGAVIKSIKFPIGPAKGYQEVDIDLVAQQVLEPYTASAAGSGIDVEAIANRVPKNIGILKLAGAQVGSILSGDLTITNEIMQDRYVGAGAFPSNAVLEGIDVACNYSCRYNTDSLRAYGALGTNLVPPTVEVTHVYQLTASLMLTIDIPLVRFEPVDLPTTNGKTMTIQMKGRGEIGASNPMLTATLINAHASY